MTEKRRGKGVREVVLGFSILIFKFEMIPSFYIVSNSESESFFLIQFWLHNDEVPSLNPVNQYWHYCSCDQYAYY